MKKLIGVHADGRVGVCSPNLAALIRLQMGRKDYDPADDIAQLMSLPDAPTEADVRRFLSVNLDPNHDEQLMRRAGDPEKKIAGHVAFCHAMNTGGLTLNEALTVIANKDLWWAVEWRAHDSVPNDDREFRAALTIDATHDLVKCRDIAHERRRALRAAEFAPLDGAIAKRIPGTDEAAVEAERQKIRDKYAAAQIAIDAAPDLPSLKKAIEDCRR